VINNASSTGRIAVGARSFGCHLGRTGLTHRKREGDGKTPIGSFRMKMVLVRKDKMRVAITAIPMKVIGQNQGWCDAIGHAAYNRMVELPFVPSHEKLFRKDSLYDIVVILDFNLHPRRQGAGSAIFFHLSEPSTQFTQGCVSVHLMDMRKILAAVSSKTRMLIGRQ
jgi:L,D-peptidoglycan transpeptidase YkuD (ErfK/YbiS/YcfS/YnhG family)